MQYFTLHTYFLPKCFILGKKYSFIQIKANLRPKINW